jgi:hypothetical protein
MRLAIGSHHVGLVLVWILAGPRQGKAIQPDGPGTVPRHEGRRLIGSRFRCAPATGLPHHVALIRSVTNAS